MSKVITEQKEFIHLLLNSTKNQARALLYTITPKQVLAISEIAYNLLQLSLDNKVKTVIHKRKRVLQGIGTKTRSVRTKTSLIKKHMTQLLSTLQLVKNQLEELL